MSECGKKQNWRATALLNLLRPSLRLMRRQRLINRQNPLPLRRILGQPLEAAGRPERLAFGFEGFEVEIGHVGALADLGRWGKGVALRQKLPLSLWRHLVHPARMAFFSTRAAAFALALLAGCATSPSGSATPHDQFFAALTTHCGQAYAGALVSGDAADADMRGAQMVMHVRTCSDTEIAVPFHVRNADGSWDRSRTWLITRTANGLRLKHDHRHEDGSADAVTFYGGDTASAGTASGQDFPVDAESIALFTANSLAASVTNVWRVEVDPAGEPGAAYAYQLSRAGRLFRVEFDLTRPLAPPPAPWGWE